MGLLSDIATKVVNVIYLVPLKVKKFSERYPDEAVLVAGGSKAVCLHEDQRVISGVKWVFSKRSALILSNRRLVCGSWNIELSQIMKAKIFKIKSFLISGIVLKVEAKDGKHYQFGLQYDQKWFNQKALVAEVEEGKILDSLLSIVVRLSILGYLVWLLISRYFIA